VITKAEIADKKYSVARVLSEFCRNITLFGFDYNANKKLELHIKRDG